MLNHDCLEFLNMLASSAPTPGGGGASAYAGALGAALGCMVARLTIGKKKYASFEEDLQVILIKCEALRNHLASLVQKDADAFEPLAKAYALPKNTEEERRIRGEVMEGALLAASLAPLEIMEHSYMGLQLQEKLAEKGSRLAVSDVGVGVQLLKASILGASMNIFINTKSMRDRPKAEEIEKKARRLIDEGTALADRIYHKVEGELA
jgi:formiminotetrahydrofolate cyclodeaminase